MALMVVPILVIPVLAQETEDSLIPGWVKGIFVYYVNDGIDDVEVINALEFLIDSNIIQLGNNTIVSEQENLSDNEKTLFELQISDRDRTISDLKGEVEEVGLHNSQLLLDVTEITESRDTVESEFEKYKEDYPLKIGNIGGKLVVDYIQELEDRIKELEN